MYRLTDEEFEGAIADALDAMPEEFLDELENIVVIAQDEPEEWQLESSGAGEEPYDLEAPDLLGYYDGISLTERGDGYGDGYDYPDTVFIFKGPHERLSDNRDVVLEEVRKTVVHELGHYFGMNEDQLDAIGYGEIDY